MLLDTNLNLLLNYRVPKLIKILRVLLRKIRLINWLEYKKKKTERGSNDL